MAVVLMETDAFDAVFDRGRASEIQGRKEGRSHTVHRSYEQAYRRPLGVIVKNIEEPRPAYIAVVDSQGKSIPIHDDHGVGPRATTTLWTAFSLQSIAESRQEKVQLVETFGEAYTFFYGEHARTMNFSGVLANAESHNWRAAFWANYERYLRGTKLVERNARIHMAWDDVIIQGYMLSASAQETADSPALISFTFSVLVTRYDNVSMYSQGEGDAESIKTGRDSIDPDRAMAAVDAAMSHLVPTEAAKEQMRQALKDRGVPDDYIDSILAAEGASPVLANRLAILQADSAGFLSRFGDALLSKVTVADMVNIGRGLLDGKRRGAVLANMGIGTMEAASEAGSGEADQFGLPLAVGAKGMFVTEGMGVRDLDGDTVRGMYGYASGTFTRGAHTTGAAKILDT